MNQIETITFWVNEFLGDSDAILTMRDDGTGDHWRIHVMAKRCFMADVDNAKKWGYLLYLHDASTLKGGAL
ncbi:MAG: hypothetical protein NTZ64_00965 [Polaromonas sp.]|nr:hypothetical protein [Polaromonas sp.]